MASELTVTLLDVGWGDSIFLYQKDAQGDHHFALIDAHDTKKLQPSMIFLKRHFKRHITNVEQGREKPYFDFVMLSHDHADHRAGLETIMKEFGANDFWYPHIDETPGLGEMLDFADKQVNKANGCINHHEALDADTPMGSFGDAEMQVLWPPANQDYEQEDPNNTSVVLSLKLGKWNVILTGDAEEEVWNLIADDIPSKTRFFKVPHHGSVNGTFDGEETPWFDKCPKAARLGISGDLRGSQVFPRKEVVDLFTEKNRKFYRTDEHYHISFWTDGDKYKVKYSRY